ncbi:MAG TPA: hypothetical protein VFS16_12915 [Acidimicrobiia bacterium]|nr:hypothetical protein [Acidimicrobiia bacterium]
MDIEEFAPLFAAGLSHLQCREVCEAALGYKVSRLNLYPAQRRAVTAWCRAHGIAVELSRYGVEEFVQPEGKGHWSNLGRRTEGRRAMRFCYMATRRADARAAREAEASEDSSPFVMAELLRIPACCAEFFVTHKHRAVTDYADDYAVLTTRATSGPGPHPWPVNYLAQYFGFSLIHHYPCSWSCPASLTRAQDSLSLVRSVSPAWAATFTREIPGVAVFENLRAVHLIQARPNPGTVDFAPHQVRSTGTTALGEALRSGGELSWTAPTSFELNGVPGDAWGDGIDRAVIPFG